MRSDQHQRRPASRGGKMGCGRHKQPIKATRPKNREGLTILSLLIRYLTPLLTYLERGNNLTTLN